MDWVTLFDGEVVHDHSLDEKRFHLFAKAYHDNKEKVGKKAFVKYAKTYIPTSRTHNRGAVQKYYSRLTIIVNFLSDIEKKNVQ